MKHLMKYQAHNTEMFIESATYSAIKQKISNDQ
jgi:hypothetical protein